MKRDWSNYGLVAIVPLVAFVILFASEVSARGAFFECGGAACSESIPENIWKVLRFDTASNNPDSPDLIEPKIMALRYSGRITWYLLGELYLFSCIAALAVAATLTYQLLPHHRLVGMSIVLMISLIVGIFEYVNPKLHMPVFLVIFERTIKPDLPGITQITDFYNSIGNAAAISLLLTSCVTLLPSDHPSPVDELKQLSKRMKSLRLVLYTGTLTLVLAMLLQKSIYQWALAYTSQEDQALEAARILVTNLISMDGVFYTLALAAVYIPAAFILQRRAQLLVDTLADETEKEKKLKGAWDVFLRDGIIP